jgi:hypothetical protein
METNFYIRRKKPTIRETVHIGKQSDGWYMHWQATENVVDEWPRWCDRDPGEHYDVSAGPSPIRSVADIRDLLATGEWELVDEYDNIYPASKLEELEEWDGGKSAYNDMHPNEPILWNPHPPMSDFKDPNGNFFSRDGFE